MPVGDSLFRPSHAVAVFAALLAAIFWNFFTWSVGLPSSSSHALVGGLIGAAVGLFGSSCVNWKSAASVVQAIFVSPIVAISVAFLSMYVSRQLAESRVLHATPRMTHP